MAKIDWKLPISGLLLCAAVGCTEEKALDAPEVATQSQALQSPAYVWSNNGSAAYASVWDPTNYAYVDASEYLDRGGRQAYLYYFAEKADPTSEVCVEECVPWCFEDGPLLPGMGGAGGSIGGDGGTGECDPACMWSYCYYERWSYEYGWGEIPAQDFNAGQRQAQLNTTLVSGDKFYIERCSYGDSLGGGCEPVTEPVNVSVNWQANQMYSSTSTGTNSFKFGPISYQSQGSYRSTSADASGTIGGFALEGNASGGLYQSRGTSIQKGVYMDGPETDGGVDSPLPRL
ncbi:MAG: hypothetical protein OEZ06_16750 [Myxococcales bacterium]|nr:hypothetical protein [Myxococcales bacterium]